MHLNEIICVRYITSRAKTQSEGAEDDAERMGCRSCHECRKDGIFEDSIESETDVDPDERESCLRSRGLSRESSCRCHAETLSG